MDNRNEAKFVGITRGISNAKSRFEALRRNLDTVTAAKCAKGYRFVQTYLPNCLNREVIEGYNRMKFRTNLFGFLSSH